MWNLQVLVLGGVFFGSFTFSAYLKGQTRSDWFAHPVVSVELPSVCRYMVHLLVLPHTVCDSSPNCQSLCLEALFGVQRGSDKPVFIGYCHGLTVLYQLLHCCTDTTLCLHFNFVLSPFSSLKHGFTEFLLWCCRGRGYINLLL